MQPTGSVQVAERPETLQGLPLVLLARCRKGNRREGVPAIGVDGSGALLLVGEADEGATFHLATDRKPSEVEERGRDVEDAHFHSGRGPDIRCLGVRRQRSPDQYAAPRIGGASIRESSFEVALGVPEPTFFLF